jgi:hypothetical protein
VKRGRRKGAVMVYVNNCISGYIGVFLSLACWEGRAAVLVIEVVAVVVVVAEAGVMVVAQLVVS